jgi:hypothetical protein
MPAQEHLALGETKRRSRVEVEARALGEHQRSAHRPRARDGAQAALRLVPLEEGVALEDRFETRPRDRVAAPGGDVGGGDQPIPIGRFGLHPRVFGGRQVGFRETRKGSRAGDPGIEVDGCEGGNLAP